MLASQLSWLAARQRRLVVGPESRTTGGRSGTRARRAASGKRLAGVSKARQHPILRGGSESGLPGSARIVVKNPPAPPCERQRSGDVDDRSLTAACNSGCPANQYFPPTWCHVIRVATQTLQYKSPQVHSHSAGRLWPWKKTTKNCVPRPNSLYYCTPRYSSASAEGKALRLTWVRSTQRVWCNFLDGPVVQRGTCIGLSLNCEWSNKYIDH